tara:strand:- start:185 stop:550 length:366 start_codon:yes stop_codon:yes gene_type:complete
MKSPKLWEPKVYEDSRLPVWLSKLSPINIWAISLVFWVFCRGKLSESGRRHETIHFQQWIELALVGFLVLYVWFWLVGLIIYRNGARAYRENPFEREAYDNENNVDYLRDRKRYSWVKYFS